MRTLIMVMMIAGLMSTVGVYAATFTGGTTANPLGGSGNETVASPSTAAVSVSWTLTGSQVTAAVVNWTPVATGNYTIQVTAGGTTGTLTGQAGTISVNQNASVTMAATEASAITTAKVTIFEE